MSKTTAVLCCDLQNDILAVLEKSVQQQIIDGAKAVLEAARKYEFLLPIYVRVAFKPGYHELSPRNPSYSQITGSQKFIDGSKGAEIVEELAPQKGDIVLTKVRVSAFSTTNLATILRAQNINNIVLCGISTSGVILSTVREAADLDYTITVLSDVCQDRLQETHDVLIKNVFPRQATVITSKDWFKSLEDVGKKN